MDVLLWIVAVEADEGGVGEALRHLLEGEADDAGSVVADAKFKQQKVSFGGISYEVAVAFQGILALCFVLVWF